MSTATSALYLISKMNQNKSLVIRQEKNEADSFLESVYCLAFLLSPPSATDSFVRF